MTATRRCLLTLTLACAALAAWPTFADEDKKPLKTEEKIALMETFADSMVFVDYELQKDKGETPGEFAGGYSGGYGDFQTLLDQERPLTMVGYVLSPTKVITDDPYLHDRFIKSITVRMGKEKVSARAASFPMHHESQILELDKPLSHARPIAFGDSDEDSYYAIARARPAAQWLTTVVAANMNVTKTQRGDLMRISGSAYQYRSLPLLFDRNGQAVGMNYAGWFPAGESWKGSPLDWPALSADQVNSQIASVQAKAESSLLRVFLGFRSPKKRDAGGRGYGLSRYSGDATATERHVPGVLIDRQTVLVLANLDAKTTARLEKIEAFQADDNSSLAEFAGSLEDYGAFVAKLKTPMEGPVARSMVDVLDLRQAILVSADMRLHGEQRQTYYQRNHIDNYDLGWKEHVYIGLAGGSWSMFTFALDGTLVALPIERRERVSMGEDRWGGYYGRNSGGLTPTRYIWDVCNHLEDRIDPNNVPLTEAQENRLAWLGVEMQAMDPELARVNEVSDLSRGGSIGALVTYIYPGSPAEKAGLELGDILLRVHVDKLPQPLDVHLGGYGYGMFDASMWEQFDALPEEYFDQVPRPWPAVDNTVNTALTDLGFGTPFRIELFRDGKTMFKDLTVEQSPPHFDTAKRFKSEDLGITVRDMTYEVRRYFQRTPEQPGVIISKIEPGSKASISGLKPYEFITHINDTPVENVKDFEELMANQDEVRLQVKRMQRGRLVKIRM